MRRALCRGTRLCHSRSAQQRDGIVPTTTMATAAADWRGQRKGRRRQSAVIAAAGPAPGGVGMDDKCAKGHTK
uniref:Uncharacterized protein n=1 Tax=Globodera rostochiensis TaxID=31243 RepID=A0A914H2X9_GLORO